MKSLFASLFIKGNDVIVVGEFDGVLLCSGSRVLFDDPSFPPSSS